MNREGRERMIDRLLNEALELQEFESRGGLEQRILAHLRSQPEPQPRWTWCLAWIPAALAAAVLLVILLKPARSPQIAPVPDAVEQNKIPAPVQQPPAPQVVARQRTATKKPRALPTVASVRATGDEPRQPVFAPARLTDAERALMTMLRSNPDEAHLALDRQQRARQDATEFMERVFGDER